MNPFVGALVLIGLIAWLGTGFTLSAAVVAAVVVFVLAPFLRR